MTTNSFVAINLLSVSVTSSSLHQNLTKHPLKQVSHDISRSYGLLTHCNCSKWYESRHSKRHEDLLTSVRVDDCLRGGGW